MKPAGVIAIAIAAAVAVSGAVWQWNANRAGYSDAARGERILPQLLGRANDVAAITVQQGKRSFRIVRKPDASYELAGSGFPVTGGKFQSALVAAASLEKFEAKTARAEKHVLIEVDDPAKPEAKGRLVRFETASGEVVGEIVLGKKARGRVGGALKDGQYVRLPGEAQSWLARGVIEGNANLATWVDAGIVEMNIDHVVKASFTPRGGETLTVRRVGVSESGNGKFEIDNLPETRKPKNDLTVRYAATDIGNSQFIDVRKAVGGEPKWQTVLTMSDGIEVEFSISDDDWLSVKIINEGKDKETMADIRKRTGGFQYRLADYKLKQFKRTLADVSDVK